MGASVQIALDKSWTGTYRVVAVMDSNLVLERAGRVFKWPKCKSRLIHDDSLDRFDSVIIPPEEEEIEKEKQKDIPSSSHSRPPDISSGLDIVDESNDTLNHPELQEAEVDESDVVSEYLNCTMFRPKDNYFHIHPISAIESTTQITCPEHYANPKWTLNNCSALYFSMIECFPVSNTFLSQENDVSTHLRNEKRGDKTAKPMFDDDIVDSFDPSRLPPRVVFHLPGARKAVEKEINDLLTPPRS